MTQDAAAISNIIVIKVGGDVIDDEALAATFAENVRALLAAGKKVVILHGGGPQVTRLQKSLGVDAVKVGGRRVTRPQDLVNVIQGICGEVNVALCRALMTQGVNAFGMHGASGKTIVAQKRPPRVVSGGDGKPVDFGAVGDVVRVQSEGLYALLHADFTPVVATLGVSEEGDRVFNINADTTVIALACALKAETLLLCTQVGAIFGDLSDESSRVSKANESEARALIKSGVIAGGMIPKVEEALKALHEGVGQVVIAPPTPATAFAHVVSGRHDFGTLLFL